MAFSFKTDINIPLPFIENLYAVSVSFPNFESIDDMGDAAVGLIPMYVSLMEVCHFINVLASSPSRFLSNLPTQLTLALAHHCYQQHTN